MFMQEALSGHFVSIMGPCHRKSPGTSLLPCARGTPTHARRRTAHGGRWYVCIGWLFTFTSFCLSLARSRTPTLRLSFRLVKAELGRDGSQRQGNPISPQLRRSQTPDVARKQWNAERQPAESCTERRRGPRFLVFDLAFILLLWLLRLCCRHYFPLRNPFKGIGRRKTRRGEKSSDDFWECSAYLLDYYVISFWLTFTGDFTSVVQATDANFGC